MKDEFKRYAQYELQTIRGNLSKRNLELLDKFLLFCGTTCGKAKLKNYERVMIKVADVLECDLDKLTSDILTKFLNVLNNSDLEDTTKNEIKKHFRRFIVWYYRDLDDDKEIKKMLRTAEEIKLANERKGNQDKINEHTILHKDSISRLIQGTPNIMDKTFIEGLYETAARPEELLNTRWGDIDFDKSTIKLKSSKTGNTRVLLVNETITQLERWRDEWTFGTPNKEDYIFIKWSRSKPISLSSMETRIKKLGEKILNKKVFPYLIRHSRLTEMHKKLPPKIYEKFADHTLATATRYSHLSNDDLIQSLKTEVYKVKELSKGSEAKLLKRIEQIEKQLHTYIDNVDKYKNEVDKYRKGYEEGVIALKELKKRLGIK